MVPRVQTAPFYSCYRDDFADPHTSSEVRAYRTCIARFTPSVIYPFPEIYQQLIFNTFTDKSHNLFIFDNYTGGDK